MIPINKIVYILLIEIALLKDWDGILSCKMACHGRKKNQRKKTKETNKFSITEYELVLYKSSSVEVFDKKAVLTKSEI